MAASWPGMFLQWMVMATIAAGLREENNLAGEVARQSELIAGTLEGVDECLAVKRTNDKCFYRNICDRPLSFTMPGFKQPLPAQEHGNYRSPYSCDQYPVEAFERYHAYEHDIWQKQQNCWKTESTTMFGNTACFAKNSCDFKLQVACNDKSVTADALYEGKVDSSYCSCPQVPPEPVKTFPKKWTVKNKAQEACFGVKKQDGQCLARNFCNESIEVDGGFEPFKANWHGRLTTTSNCDRFSQEVFDVFLQNEKKQWQAEVQKWKTQQKCFHSIKTVNEGCVVSNSCADESLIVRCNNCGNTITLKAHKDYFAQDKCFCSCDSPQPPEPR
eukprot:TRINITY_DN107748_c0_g1_i1.p1 TRINITY_DN107748_c0_g1~~TRINITY_DN107748_c0_g1_i1.p1  ORF type:complete len:347 (-),score=76.05 TRINITY_DN107748_c0_g1_i1:92-1081(-)